MLALPTDPDGFPAETELETKPCDECGATGYYPAHQGPPYDAPATCESCHREQLRSDLARDPEAFISRADALQRLISMDYLPVRDPEDDRLIIEAETDHVPGTGKFVKSMTKIVDADCPECGYDRANESFWRAYTFESGESTTCRACGHVIEEHSTL